MRSKDIEQAKRLVDRIEELWSHVRPGARVCGVTNSGEHFVAPSNDPQQLLGCFSNEAEARAFASAAEHVEELTGLIKLLVKDREEALEAFREINATVEPAHAAFEAQEPVDMKSVINTTRKWTRYILESQNGQH